MPDKVGLTDLCGHRCAQLIRQEEALQDLLQHMSLYPPDTVFFLNVWCFG